MNAYLIKYDLISIFKKLLPASAILVCLSILTRIISEIGYEFRVFEILSGLFIFAFYLAVIAFLSIIFILVILRFYKNVLKDQGYLTNTLPVSKISILTSNTLTSFIAGIYGTVVLIIAFVILYFGTDSIFVLVIKEIANDFNTNAVYFLSYLFLFIIVGYISKVIFCYASLAIGHSFSKNKIGFSILTGIAIYFILQIISAIVAFIPFFIFGNDIYNTNEEPLILLFLNIIIVTTVVTTTVLFFITNYFLSKKLNLE